MSAASRGRELAADLARRVAERDQEQDPEQIADRIRGAADADGRISADKAVEALTGEPERPDPFAPHRAKVAAKQAAMHERLFPSTDSPEPSTEPKGDVDAGKGDAGGQRIEHVNGEVMEVLDLDQVMDPERRS